MITSLSEIMMLTCGDDYMDSVNESVDSTIEDSNSPIADFSGPCETVVIQNPFETPTHEHQREVAGKKSHNINPDYNFNNCFNQSQAYSKSGYSYNFDYCHESAPSNGPNYLNNFYSVWASNSSRGYESSYNPLAAPSHIVHSNDNLLFTNLDNQYQYLNCTTTTNDLQNKKTLPAIYNTNQIRHYNGSGKCYQGLSTNCSEIYRNDSLNQTVSSDMNNYQTHISKINHNFNLNNYQSGTIAVAHRHNTDVGVIQLHNKDNGFSSNPNAAANSGCLSSLHHGQNLYNVESFQIYSSPNSNRPGENIFLKEMNQSRISSSRNLDQCDQISRKDRTTGKKTTNKNMSKSNYRNENVQRDNLSEIEKKSDSTAKSSPVHVISLRQLFSESGRKHFWSEAETKCLLTVFHRPEIQIALGRLSKRHSTWRLTADLMRRFGYPRSARQCRQKLAQLLGPEVTDQRRQAARHANTRLPAYSHYYQQQQNEQLQQARDQISVTRDCEETLEVSQKTYPVGILRKPRDPETDLLVDGPPVSTRRVHWRNVHIYIENNAEWPAQIDLTIPLYHLHPETG